ncbi:hypothetical protein GOP47_0018419 [Adiantum capillus-veneris]|uniref:Uncharacterized protein n=1 Tax=Adiantum capillus-veneris TaxID=13818 RepID=A0A9D4UDD3_ADICA|nr:hypothetical protein GOP47_0018419 [Adiantum capillus-veneris]
MEDTMPCVAHTQYDTATDIDELVELDEGLIESYAHDDGDAWEYVADEHITSDMMHKDVAMGDDEFLHLMEEDQNDALMNTYEACTVKMTCHLAYCLYRITILEGSPS